MALSKLNVSNELFKELVSNPPKWWTSLINGEDINIEVRKDNYIDVYFNGGCIIKKLQYSSKSGKYSGTIHFEYIPLESNENYVPFNFNANSVELDKTKLNFISLNNFDVKALAKIKKRITHFFDSASEKAIQAKFIKNDPYFIDNEFAFFYNKELLRIDLVRVDIKNSKIVMIEVKRMGDSRLYTNEITQQLEKYYLFLKTYNSDVLEYYKKMFQIKKVLKILPKGLEQLDTLDGYTVEVKPLLLFGDCQQKWIVNNAAMIDDKIKDCAIGSYYFGQPKYDCSLIPKSKRNQHIF